MSSDDRTVLPAAYLVLQSLEVDDVGVDGDTDRHDETRHTRERERRDLGGVERNDVSVKNSMPVSARPHTTTRPSSR